ncbi:MAG TPA: NAD-dependent epimerase/dehydratase family protein [Candidatus Dormibacteraeota bacterium]
MSTILVTGGAGFIGSHTVDALLQSGHDVRVLDSLQSRVHPKGRPSYLPSDIELIVGDVSDRATLSKALAGVDGVMHLAAYQDYLPDFSSFIHTNSESSALLFELIVEQRLPIHRILFASSQAVAGEGRYACPVHGPLTPDPRSVEQLERAEWEIRCPQCGSELSPLLIEETVCRPHTAYGISKYAIELLAAALGSRYGIATACMRYTYVQGARNSFYNAYSGICRTFALRIRNGLPPICYEDGGQRRDYVNVRDVARANVMAFEALRGGHHVYNVGGGKAITVLQFARLMLQACASSLQPSVPGLFRLGDTRHTVSDISRMQALGWQPTIPVEQNIHEYLEWMSDQRETRAYLEEAERMMRQQNVVRPAALKV